MPFDPNKYRNIAQQQFGQNAFNFNNLNSAASLQAEASRLRDKVSGLINDRIKQINSPKKTYQDAVNYWSQNKAQFQKDGAYKVANDILNDPAKQAEIKAQGFNVSDYINGLYNAASNGQFRSQREYGQYNSNLKKEISARDKAYKKQHGGLTQDEVYAMQKQSQSNSNSKKGNSLLSDLGNWYGAAWKSVGQSLNPFDNVSAAQAWLNKDKALKGNEVNRFVNRAVDSTVLNGISGAENQAGINPDWAKTRKFGQGGLTDLISSGIGYFVPGEGALKGAKAVGIGAKLTKAAENATRAEKALNTVRNAGQLAKQGAGAGLLFGAAQQGLGETVNPNGADLKQRLANIGLDTAIGAVGDPLLHVAGTKIAKFFGKDKVAKSELDSALNNPNTPGTHPNFAQESAATHENISTQKEPKYINATSNDGGKLVKAVENNIPNATYLKDLKPRQIHWQDPMRNLRQVLGKAAEPIINRFDKAKGQLFDFQKSLADKLNKEIVQGLGIKKGSKESALVQRYGEGNITLDELKQLAPNKWKDIVKADQWFKQQYDNLLNEVNAVRSKLYPNQPDKLVPKRDNYYRHFRDLNGLQGIKNLFETPAGIDPHLVGTSEFTKPNSKFASFMQKRGLGPFKNDAVGGFLDYLPAAGYAKYIDPQIKVFNQLKNDLATQTEGSKNINNFLTFLDRLSQDLAGKTNPADRWIQENVSRKAFRIVNALNSRIKSNVILGNVGSALSQLANIPQGVAFAKQYSVKGAGKTLLSIFHESPEMAKSSFLKERYHHKIYRQFDTKLLQQPKKFAEWMMETADRIGTSFVWNSAYTKAVAKNIKDPVKYADNATRDLVAGRGIGEVPIAQKSKLVQLIAPFQLEVGNLWKVQKGFVKQKDFGALITFYLAAHLMNKGFEQLRGTSIIFDPIQAIQDASKDNLTFTQRAGRVMGEILSNIPLGQTAAAEYPQYGFTAFGKKMPTRKQLFGENDPTRFGTGIANVLSSGLKDPAFKILPPFGGYQAEKTFKALQDLKNKGHYNKDQSKLSYPVTPSDGNIMKGLLFGPSAISNAQDYYNNNRRPLSVNQTKAYNSVSDKTQYYKDLMKKRKEKSSGK